MTVFCYSIHQPNSNACRFISAVRRTWSQVVAILVCMRDGVRPNVVCTLPIVALWGLDCLELQAGGRGANGSPQRYHGSKVMTPTAALGTYLPRSSFQANPMHIGISHGVDPRAASRRPRSAPRSIASDPEPSCGQG